MRDQLSQFPTIRQINPFNSFYLVLAPSPDTTKAVNQECGSGRAETTFSIDTSLIVLSFLLTPWTQEKQESRSDGISLTM